MSTRPHIILIVVLTLALSVFGGMFGVFTLIQQKADPALIAVMAGFVGTALGGVLSILNNTRSPGQTGDTPLPPTQTEIVNTPSNPVPTTDQP